MCSVGIFTEVYTFPLCARHLRVFRRTHDELHVTIRAVWSRVMFPLALPTVLHGCHNSQWHSGFPVSPSLLLCKDTVRTSPPLDSQTQTHPICRLTANQILPRHIEKTIIGSIKMINDFF